MAARSENKKWLQEARKNWLVLAQGGLWIGGILGGFLLSPPVGVSAADEKIWLRLGQFIIAVVLGLVFFAARRWSHDTPRTEPCRMRVRGISRLDVALGRVGKRGGCVVAVPTRSHGV
jgi:hypothetical protein